MFLRPLKILVLLVMVWVEDDNGIKCLRVPSGRNIAIDYETFSDFIQAQKTGSLTFEIDYAIRNVTNEDEPILRMCSYTKDNNSARLGNETY